MPPIVHCVRHAQGFHNLNVNNHSMPDPLLTPVGEEQCRILHKDFPDPDRIDLIVASPLKRTIYTALLSFENVISDKQLKIIALPELQETSDLPCDTGSSPEELAREFEGKPVDLSLVKPGWDSKRMKWAPTAQAIQKRALEARQWLMNRPEKDIVVVTHGGFLHYFTEDWNESSKFSGTGWENTEFRTYGFSDHDTMNAHLIEEPRSRERRKEDKPLDQEEHLNLTRTVSEEHKRRNREHEAAKQDATQAHQVQQIQAKAQNEQRGGIGGGYESYL